VKEKCADGDGDKLVQPRNWNNCKMQILSAEVEDDSYPTLACQYPHHLLKKKKKPSFMPLASHYATVLIGREVMRLWHIYVFSFSDSVRLEEYRYYSGLSGGL